MSMTSWLRVEGAALFLGATAVYWHAGGEWWLFAFLLFAPDITMLGYLGGSRLGARIYNLGHTTVGPIVLFVGSLLLDWPPLTTELALIWLAHIGVDRALAFGLKRPTGFRQTRPSPAIFVLAS